MFELAAMRRFLIALLVTGIGLTADFGAIGSPVVSPAKIGAASVAGINASSTILFARGNDIWSMLGDGSVQTQLTHEGSTNYANQPVYSPDGTQIAYGHHIQPAGNSWGGAEIHVMNADGSNDQVIASGAAKGERFEQPAWLPTGHGILYSHDLPIIDQTGAYTGDRVTLERLDFGAATPVTLGQNAVMPASSKSGRIAFMTYNPGLLGFQLIVTSPGGSAASVLVSDKTFWAIWSPRLSPDGKWLLFSGSGGGTGGGGPLGLLGDASPLAVPSALAHGLPWDPWVIGTDGTGLRRLAQIGSDEQGLAWTPDGQGMLMANLDGIFGMKIAGGALGRIIQQGDPGSLDIK